MPIPNPAPEPARLSPEALNAALAADPDLVLVEVLPRENYRRSHLPRAVHACVYEVTFPQQMREQAPDPARAVVLYGHGGESRDASVAAAKLQRMGYRDIRVLAVGKTGWHAAELPLEGEEPVPVEPPGVPAFAPGSYAVDVKASRIRWEGRNPNGAHDGTVALAGGVLEVDEKGVIGGRFEVDLRTIRNDDLAGDPSPAALVAHLESDDFFFVEHFPTAEFTILRAARIAAAGPTEPNYEVRGELELRGMKAPLDFVATLSRLGDGRLAAEAHFDLDRTRWGVIYGSARFFAHLGKHVVFDPISFRVRIVVG